MGMNALIPMMGHGANMSESFDRGQQAFQRQQEFENQNALRAALQQYGPAAMSGDQNALRELAKYDPNLSMGLMGDQQAMDIQRQGNARAATESQHGMRIDDEQLALARQQAAEQTAEHAAKMSAYEREAANAAIDRGVAALSQAKTPEEWDEFAKKDKSTEDMVGQFDQRDMFIAQALGVKDALEMSAGPQPQSPAGKLQADINAGLITPEQAKPAPKPQSPQGKINADIEAGLIDANTSKYDVKGETALRKEFNLLPPVKDFQTQSTAMGRIEASASEPSAAGDMALIFSYMKLLDPGSTVREGEYATAAQAGSVPERLIAIYNKVLAGETLSDEMRKDFVARAGKLYAKAKDQTAHVVRQYRNIAKSRGLDPTRTIPDFDMMAAEQPEFPNAPPIGTVEEGHAYKGGDPADPASWEKVGM